MRRVACIVIVEAPLTRRSEVTFWNVARTTLGRFTPECSKKRRSSAATSAFTIQSSLEAA